jgi:hypothetical protein
MLACTQTSGIFPVYAEAVQTLFKACCACGIWLTQVSLDDVGNMVDSSESASTAA